jgi:type II secretory pathway pseudopilin PulG
VTLEGPAARCGRAVPVGTRSPSGRGYSLLEVVLVLGMALTVSALAVPQSLAAIDDFRAMGAARYISARLQRARMEAVMRSAEVAMQFSETPEGYTYAVFLDGNRNGVLARDIQNGSDRCIGAHERLFDQFTGVDFGAIPGLPAIDLGGTPPGADPIRLGASGFASFSARGSSSTGTVYIRSRRDAQYAVRIFGDTGKTRMLKFDRHTGRWRPL